MTRLSRVLVVLAGLAGAAGVAAAAAASHGESRNLSAMATILLAHAPALLAVGLFGKGRALLVAGLVLAMGTTLFVVDLATREVLGQALFAGAAPLGGGVMILGWLALAAVGALGPKAS